MALAVVLLIQAVVAFLRGDGLFSVDLGTVCTWVAALLFGGFATMSREQKPSRGQVFALGAAVVLVAISVLVPTTPWFTMEPFWIVLYAATAFVCALILRRSAS